VLSERQKPIPIPAQFVEAGDGHSERRVISLYS
jgi:hypothetical protein